jgi:curved DNA-binding protein CbpA
MSQPRFNPADFALLGAPAGADEAAVRKSFLQAVKAARPDQGGDPERYREIIAAWRRLNARPADDDLDVTVELEISEAEARDGGARLVPLPTGRTVKVTLPAGLRTGRSVRLRRQGLSAPGRWGDVYLRITVADAAPVEDVPARPSASDLLRRFAESWAA